MTEHESPARPFDGSIGPDGVVPPSDADAVELDDVASRALASIILERTSDAMNGDNEQAGTALLALEKDTGLPLDVCAAILYVTSWFAGLGGIEAEAIYAASLTIEPDETDDAPVTE